MKTRNQQLIQSWKNGEFFSKIDNLGGEEALAILIDFYNGQKWVREPLAVIMRSPGFDRELALGFLYSEGVIRSWGDLEKIEERQQRVVIQLQEHIPVNLEALTRHVLTNSSCGMCSQANIEQVLKHCPMPAPRVSPLLSSILVTLPETLRNSQKEFSATGGMHASGLFRSDGTLIMAFEDIGRHNALDKLVGRALEQGLLPLTDSILLLSGRVSFELVQKAAQAGIPSIAALGAPSSLACQLAKSLGITLIGFLREASYNLYCGEPPE